MKAIGLFVITLAFTLSLGATQYQYPISGNTGDPKDEKILIVDTESPDFKARLDWISERASLLPPKIEDYMNHAPAVANANPIPGSDSPVIWGQACWVKQEKRFCIDVRTVATGPEGPMHALAGLNIALGLGKDQDTISHWRYAPPKPPKPPEDCGAPGSPVACEELPGQPGKFKSRGLGRKIGDEWIGPSGARYVLRNIGGIFMYLAWVRQ